MSTLLLILSEDLDTLARKGEMIPNYYNPRGVFDTIVVLAARGKTLPVAALPLFGTAEVRFRPVGVPPLGHPSGWLRLRTWWRNIARTAATSEPDVIRTYSSGWVRLVALVLSKQLRVPYVCSTHETPDALRLQRARTYPMPSLRGVKVRLHSALTASIDRICIPRASAHLCVYESAAEYVRRCGGGNVHVIYNTVSSLIQPKTNYTAARPPEIVTVGQQTRGIKEPSAIIRSMERVDATLEVIGDGDFHDDLVAMAEASPILKERVRFRRFIPNQELVERLRIADIVAYRTLSPEFSKILIEAMLSAAPIVASRLKDCRVVELESTSALRMIDDTPGAWADAFNELLTDDAARAALGGRALARARLNYAPESMERAHADLYKQVLAGEPAAPKAMEIRPRDAGTGQRLKSQGE